MSSAVRCKSAKSAKASFSAFHALLQVFQVKLEQNPLKGVFRVQGQEDTSICRKVVHLSLLVFFSYYSSTGSCRFYMCGVTCICFTCATVGRIHAPFICLFWLWSGCNDIVHFYRSLYLPHPCNSMFTALSVIIYLRKYLLKNIWKKKSSNHRFGNRKQ